MFSLNISFGDESILEPVLEEQWICKKIKEKKN